MRAKRYSEDQIIYALKPAFPNNIFMRIILHLFIFFCSVAVITATDHYVSTSGTNDVGGGYPDWAGAATQIQWAVDAASAGDTVLVSNGIYTTTTPVFDGEDKASSNVVALTNANITLRSVNGPLVTIIDGSSKWRVVSITNTSTLNGFTIRNGTASTLKGGGIKIVSPPGTIIITNCIVHDNLSGYSGGVYAYDCYTVIANCMIYSNVATYGGGGMVMGYAKTSVVDRCVFFGNESRGTGGGPLQYGGGLQIFSSKCFVRNGLFYRNASYSSGGGLFLREGETGGSKWSTIENCTFAGNISSNAGGGIAMYDDPYVNKNILRNLIIYNNSATSNYADVYATNAIMTNCCVGHTNGVINWNTSGNITNDPQFVAAAFDNYRLRANSPCINTGTNQDWMNNSYDLDGRVRIRYGIVDMGAYERVNEGTIYYIY